MRKAANSVTFWTSHGYCVSKGRTLPRPEQPLHQPTCPSRGWPGSEMRCVVMPWLTPTSSRRTPKPSHKMHASSSNAARWRSRCSMYLRTVPSAKLLSSTAANLCAPAASKPSPSLLCQYLQPAQTSGASAWQRSARGRHHHTLFLKYSPVLAVGLRPNTSMPIVGSFVGAAVARRKRDRSSNAATSKA